MVKYVDGFLTCTLNIIEIFLNVNQFVGATAIKNVVVDSRTISIKEKKVRVKRGQQGKCHIQMTSLHL